MRWCVACGVRVVLTMALSRLTSRRCVIDACVLDDCATLLMIFENDTDV